MKISLLLFDCSQCDCKAIPGHLARREDGVSCVLVRCPNGHGTLVPMPSSKPLSFEHSPTFPPGHLQYHLAANGSATLQCPLCRTLISVPASRIKADGSVRPSLVCPSSCGLHAWAKLLPGTTQPEGGAA
jgi:hypothetical protein